VLAHRALGMIVITCWGSFGTTRHSPVTDSEPGCESPGHGSKVNSAHGTPLPTSIATSNASRVASVQTREGAPTRDGTQGARPARDRASATDARPTFGTLPIPRRQALCLRWGVARGYSVALWTGISGASLPCMPTCSTNTQATYFGRPASAVPHGVLSGQ
jgi:hypothetical protein